MNTFNLADPTRRDKWKKKRLIKSVGIPVAVGIFAFGVGASTVAEAEPVEVVKEVPVEKIVTETETVEITPNACLTALDLAENNFGHYSDGFMIAAEIPSAIASLDAALVEDLSGQLDDLRKNDLDPTLAAYYMNAEECRGAGA